MSRVRYVLAGLAIILQFGACLAQKETQNVAQYYVDNGEAVSAEDYLREAQEPEKASVTYWQVQLFRPGSLMRDSAWGAISGMDWKTVLDQYNKELDFERSYQTLFDETPPLFQEKNYKNYVAPVAVRIKKNSVAKDSRKFVQELPGMNGKLNRHIDFFLTANKTIEDNDDVLMSNELRNQLKNYASELMRIVKEVRSKELEYSFYPDPLRSQLLLKGDRQGKGGVDEALILSEKLLPVLEKMMQKEYSPDRPRRNE